MSSPGPASSAALPVTDSRLSMRVKCDPASRLTRRVSRTETPSPHTRHGIKGVGEGGAIAPPAAILNAVNAALAEFGIEFNETPLNSHRLLTALLARRERIGGQS